MTPKFVKAILALTALTNNVNMDIAKPIVITEQYNYPNPVIEIPKINLKQEVYPFNQEKNHVNKNIQVINGSEMPTKKHSNLILASHSGTSSIAYFKNLYKVNYNDVIYIYYQKTKYKYVIADIYDVPKTGYIEIKRNQSKNAITLITCKKNTNMQTVYIGYLEITELLHK